MVSKRKKGLRGKILAKLILELMIKLRCTEEGNRNSSSRKTTRTESRTRVGNALSTSGSPGAAPCPHLLYGTVLACLPGSAVNLLSEASHLFIYQVRTPVFLLDLSHHTVVHYISITRSVCRPSLCAIW